MLLDFSKAFGKVSHEKLLLKHHRYGIRGYVLHWIKTFLANRSQTSSQRSSQVKVTSGVRTNFIFGLHK